MSDIKFSFVEAICEGHRQGLDENSNSMIIGEGVTYPNGADGTTKNLMADFPNQLFDVPISEAAFTGMAVGMATSGLNPIVHHGRVEFSLLAMDQILTQAAKWNFMFGGDYSCTFASRINIGRQWGNGPQHTSSYNSLFYNTPGLALLWPSRPSEAFVATKVLHNVTNPTLSMEHRYLFQVQENISETVVDLQKNSFPLASLYKGSQKNLIVTYGDGLIEALKVRERWENGEPPSVICLTSFNLERTLPNALFDLAHQAESVVVIDTSNYTGGLMQAIVGHISERVDISKKLKIFSPPFTPCPTSPVLTKDYYPKSYKIAQYYRDVLGLAGLNYSAYDFDEDHLPANFDFSTISCDYFWN